MTQRECGAIPIEVPADGRTKPDIVSPGSAIVSVKSAYKDGNFDLNDYYSVKSGTSMATPITAGTVALLIEYLNNSWI